MEAGVRDHRIEPAEVLPERAGIPLEHACEGRACLGSGDHRGVRVDGDHVRSACIADRREERPVSAPDIEHPLTGLHVEQREQSPREIRDEAEVSAVSRRIPCFASLHIDPLGARRLVRPGEEVGAEAGRRPFACSDGVDSNH